MSVFPPDLLTMAATLLAEMRAEKLTLVTAESCTGGLIAGLFTEIAGSSDVVDRGFVTYSNAAKQDLLGVQAATLQAHGAVSAETAREMAWGALRRSQAHIAVAITGVAGPGGGSADKPVGLVHFGCAHGDETTTVERRFGDLGRERVRMASVVQALDMLRTAAAEAITKR